MVCKMKINETAEDIKSIIKNAANKMSSAKRKEYIGYNPIKVQNRQ